MIALARERLTEIEGWESTDALYGGIIRRIDFLISHYEQKQGNR